MRGVGSLLLARAIQGYWLIDSPMGGSDLRDEDVEGDATEPAGPFAITLPTLPTPPGRFNIRVRGHHPNGRRSMPRSPVTLAFLTEQLELADYLLFNGDRMFEPQDLPGELRPRGRVD